MKMYIVSAISVTLIARHQPPLELCCHICHKFVVVFTLFFELNSLNAIWLGKALIYMVGHRKYRISIYDLLDLNCDFEGGILLAIRCII